MRFFLDENEKPLILESLRLVYRDHEFSSWQDERLSGLDDTPLIHEVGARGSTH